MRAVCPDRSRSRVHTWVEASDISMLSDVKIGWSCIVCYYHGSIPQVWRLIRRIIGNVANYVHLFHSLTSIVFLFIYDGIAHGWFLLNKFLVSAFILWSTRDHVSFVCGIVCPTHFNSRWCRCHSRRSRSTLTLKLHLSFLPSILPFHANVRKSFLRSQRLIKARFLVGAQLGFHFFTSTGRLVPYRDVLVLVRSASALGHSSIMGMLRCRLVGLIGIDVATLYHRILYLVWIIKYLLNYSII